MHHARRLRAALILALAMPSPGRARAAEFIVALTPPRAGESLAAERVRFADRMRALSLAPLRALGDGMASAPGLPGR